MLRTIRENRLITAVVIAAILNIATSCIFAVVSYQARERICDAIDGAFDGYTKALVAESGAPPEREQSFRNRYQPELEDCN